MTPLGPLTRALAAVLGIGPLNRSGSSYALTVITPILSGQTEALRAVLRGFGARPKSPLDRIPDVQFARWVIVDKLRADWPGAPRRPSTLASDYLLFSADLTAPAERARELPKTFLRDLAEMIPEECKEVWGKCQGFPGLEGDGRAFVAYLRSSQIDIGLYYAAFPDLTPPEIKNVVGVRDDFGRLAVRCQSATTPAKRRALKHEYDLLSASWDF